MSSSVPLTYVVPAREHEEVLEVKRSRFVTTLARAATTEEARNVIQQVRAKDPSATHHCWAFIAGPPTSDSAMGYSDDGEPSGTAGRPMLTVLQYAEVGEIVAVVSRTFGGQKLGTGGLVRAYSQAVSSALDTLPTYQWIPRMTVLLRVAYEAYEPVKRALHDPDILWLDTAFDVGVSMTLAVPIARVEKLRQLVQDATAGRASWVSMEDATT